MENSEISANIPQPRIRSVSPTQSTSSSVSLNTTSTTAESIIIKQADTKVVCRDIFVSIFDVLGDATYLFYLYLNEETVRHRHNFDVQSIILLIISLIGVYLSIWLIMASAERSCRAQMSCCGCNVPRLSTYLIAIHHVPVCLLTTMIDLTFLGGYTLAGILNIGTSGVAMVNALRTTKCGEGHCSDKAFCGGRYHRRHDELSKDVNVNGVMNNEEYYEKPSDGTASIGSGSDDSVNTEYKAMV